MLESVRSVLGVDAAAVVGESSLAAKSADDFLQRLDVAVAQDGADHLDLVVIDAALLCPSSPFARLRKGEGRVAR